VDALVDLLDGPRARGAFVKRAVLEPPWSLRIEDRAPLTLVALVKGAAWVVHDDGEPVAMRPGDVAIIRGSDPYTVASAPGIAPQVVVHPGQHCTTPDGVSLAEAMELGIRTWGKSLTGSTAMLVGTYQVDGDVSRRLLAALPPRLILSDDALDGTLVGLLGKELAKDDPGQEAVLDRLLDLLLIAVLRAWFARPDAEAPGWYRAHGDAVVGAALRMLHDDPSRPWTVASLAAAVGVSRAALARRFMALVGEPPMTYLAAWRLSLAADLLREPEATVGSVAHQVGYASPFALSTAFKRVHGVSPRQHRVAAAAAAAAG